MTRCASPSSGSRSPASPGTAEQSFTAALFVRYTQDSHIWVQARVERAATRPGAELLRPSSSQLTPECGERCLDFARHLHLLGRAATVGFYQEAGLMAAILLTAWPGNNFLPGSCVLLFWWSTVPRSGPLEAAGLQHSCRESLQQLWDTAAASAPCLP